MAKKERIKLVSRLRSRAALIMFIVLVAFVLLIVLQWGADILGIGYREQKNIEILAKVGNKEITISLFHKYLQRELRNIPREELNEKKYKEIKEKAWKEIIKEIVLERVAKKENVRITDDELFEVIKTNPPPEVQQLKELQTEDGKFDYNKYLQILANPSNLPFIMQFAERLKAPLLQEKLRQDILNCYRITSIDYKDIYEKYNKNIFLEGLFITRLGDTKIDTVVTEEEMRSYYNKHKEEFELPERIKVDKISFPIIPSSQDSLEIKGIIEDIYSQIKEGADFFKIGKLYSERKLDTMKILKQRIRKKRKTIMEKMKPGDISSPFFYGNAWRILKLLSSKKDTLYFSEIVINMRASSDTKRDILEKIESLRKEMKKNKAPIEVIANKYKGELTKDLVISKKRSLYGFSEYENAIKTWAFKARVGEVSLPFSENGIKYSVFILKEKIPKGIEKFEEAKSKIRRKILWKRYKKTLKNMAENIKKMLLSGATLKEVHEKYPFLKYEEELNFPNFWLASGTYGPKFAGIIFALKEGESYGPIELGRGYIFVKCTKIGFNNIKPSKILKDRVTYAISILANEVFKNPEIEDYRNALNY